MEHVCGRTAHAAGWGTLNSAHCEGWVEADSKRIVTCGRGPRDGPARIDSSLISRKDKKICSFGNRWRAGICRTYARVLSFNGSAVICIIGRCKSIKVAKEVEEKWTKIRFSSNTPRGIPRSDVRRSIDDSSVFLLAIRCTVCHRFRG